MVVVRKPMTCPSCDKKISFLSSLFRRSNLSFECPNCKMIVGVSLDRRYWKRQIITLPIYLSAIAAFTNFQDFESILSLRNISMVLLIGVIGTYEGWRLFWFLELKDKAHKWGKRTVDFRNLNQKIAKSNSEFSSPKVKQRDCSVGIWSNNGRPNWHS